MQAFYYANHNNQQISSVIPPPKDAKGYYILGDLELPAGSYLVFAKANAAVATLGVNKPSNIVSHGGQFVLKLGTAGDDAISGLRFEDGASTRNISLFVAGDSVHSTHVCLYFASAQPAIEIFINSVVMIALRVKTLKRIEVGAEVDGPTSQQELALLSELALSAGVRMPVLP